MLTFESLCQKEEKIAVVGLGYVGLPLAVHLAMHFAVIGYDLKSDRIKELENNYDRTYEVTEEDLREEFGAFGEVASVNIITDKLSGRPKGFGFVEMASKSEAEAAIAGLNGKTLKERTIVVNEARPRK